MYYQRRLFMTNLVFQKRSVFQEGLSASFLAKSVDQLIKLIYVIELIIFYIICIYNYLLTRKYQTQNENPFKIAL